MLPLSLLYSGIGVSITGIIIRSRVVMWSPLVGFCFAIYMLMAYTLHQAVTIDWYLYFWIVVCGHDGVARPLFKPKGP